tara:strand:- start:792 stop:1133 length:342 start_codon:yes stop_codon:yes gene_type:complete
MELALETYRKAKTHDSSEEIGRTKLTINPEDYRKLEHLEETLKKSGQSEMLLNIKDGMFDIDTPQGNGNLLEPRLRMFLDQETEAALFHVVARSSADNSLIYTEPTLVRLVAM